MIDGYEGDLILLNSREIMENILDELPKRLGMHVLLGPHITQAPDNGLKDPGGWSGFIIIAESHISIHTFPKRGFLSADLYTCKNGLDKNFVIEYIKSKYALKQIEQNFVIRGVRYPEKNIL